jgi:EVE domain
LDHAGRVSGFRERRWGVVKRIKPGDLLLCYLTGVQRWVGVLKVVAPPYRDTAPIRKSEAFPCRLTVEPFITPTPEASSPPRPRQASRCLM